MNTKKKWALRYTCNFENRKEGYELKDVENDYHGLCDAILFMSIIREKDGGYSQVNLSIDGKTGKQLTQDDLCKAWCVLACELYDRNELKGWKKELVDGVSGMVRSIFKQNREDFGGSEDAPKN